MARTRRDIAMQQTRAAVRRETRVLWCWELELELELLSAGGAVSGPEATRQR